MSIYAFARHTDIRLDINFDLPLSIYTEEESVSLSRFTHEARYWLGSVTICPRVVTSGLEDDELYLAVRWRRVGLWTPEGVEVLQLWSVHVLPFAPVLGALPLNQVVRAHKNAYNKRKEIGSINYPAHLNSSSKQHISLNKAMIRKLFNRRKNQVHYLHLKNVKCLYLNKF